MDSSSAEIPDSVRVAIERLLEARGESPHETKAVAGGANSKVIRVTSTSGKRYAAKRYPPRTGDSRNRLRTEFDALSFLFVHGIRNIPEPVSFAESENVALYGWLEGEHVISARISSRHVDQAVSFLGSIHSLTGIPETATLPIASEACFSISEHLELIDRRFQRLSESVASLPPGSHSETPWKALDDFLRTAMEDEILKMKRNVEEKAAAAAINPDLALDCALRTLSPSDFGFHNALESMGSLAFFDFEYFGWDDPAKLIADFFLQPAIPLPANLRQAFFSKVREVYSGDARLPVRVSLIYDILSLKWCMIMLNPWLRKPLPHSSVLLASLEKAMAQLEKWRQEAVAAPFPRFVPPHLC